MSKVLKSNMKSSQELQQLTPIKKRIREDRLKMSNVECQMSKVLKSKIVIAVMKQNLEPRTYNL